MDKNHGKYHWRFTTANVSRRSHLEIAIRHIANTDEQHNAFALDSNGMPRLWNQALFYVVHSPADKDVLDLYLDLDRSLFAYYIYDRHGNEYQADISVVHQSAKYQILLNLDHFEGRLELTSYHASTTNLTNQAVCGCHFHPTLFFPFILFCLDEMGEYLHSMRHTVHYLYLLDANHDETNEEEKIWYYQALKKTYHKINAEMMTNNLEPIKSAESRSIMDGQDMNAYKVKYERIKQKATTTNEEYMIAYLQQEINDDDVLIAYILNRMRRYKDSANWTLTLSATARSDCVAFAKISANNAQHLGFLDIAIEAYLELSDATLTKHEKYVKYQACALLLMQKVTAC